MDVVKVSRQILQRVKDFTDYQKRLNARRNALLVGLPKIRDSLKEGVHPASQYEAFPSAGLHYGLNIVFKDIEDIKHWAAQQLRDVIVIAVDGSQINFDRHVSPRIAMIQAGYVILVGAKRNKKLNIKGHVESELPGGYALVDTIPHVYGPQELVDLVDEGAGLSEQSAVSYWRWEQETKVSKCLIHVVKGLKLECTQCKFHGMCSIPLLKDRIPKRSKVVMFVDGTLIMSFVQALESKLRKQYIHTTNQFLEICKQHSIPVIGYIAHSNARELAESLWMIKNDKPLTAKDKVLLPIDSSLFNHELEQLGDRTPLFASHRKVLQSYKVPIGFFYQKVDVNNPVRIEVPLFMCTRDGSGELLDLVWKVITAQVSLGRGYPYVLARAHEAAVLGGTDRNKFYQMVDRILRKYGSRIIESSKSRRKRSKIL